MIPTFSLQHFRFHLEPKAPLHLPAYNKGSTLRLRRERSAERLTPRGNGIRGGFGSAFRWIACRIAALLRKNRAGGGNRLVLRDGYRWLTDGASSE